MANAQEDKKANASKRVSKKKRVVITTVQRTNALLIVGGLIFGLIVGLAMNSSMITGAAVSKGAINEDVSSLFPQIEVTEVEDLGSMYMVSFTSQGRPGTFYVTNDGKFALIGQAIDLEIMAKELGETGVTAEAEEAVEVPKTETPDVEVFVMSYCPYGLQMEKAVLPVQNLLGEYANFDIKFVHYVMHGEKESVENARQYCIRENEPEKLWSYLDCFITEGEGNEQLCMALSEVDILETESCIIAARTDFKIDEDLASGATYPAFRIDKDVSESYGVQGSPTVVINGQIVSMGRTPESVKQAVCDAFIDAPDVCDTELSTEGFNPGFGSEAGSGDSTASCG